MWIAAPLAQPSSTRAAALSYEAAPLLLALGVIHGYVGVPLMTYTPAARRTSQFVY